MEEVFLLTGSNLGDRKENLAQALRYLHEEVGAIFQQSNIYESEPWGFTASTPFFNQVVAVRTMLTPDDLLDTLLKIEIRMGRIRYFSGAVCSGDNCGILESKPVYESRVIDLDILFYGSRMVFTDRLMIPHPRLHLRRFTMVPMVEIAPSFIHPLLRKSMVLLLKECPDDLKVKMLG